VLLTPVSCIIVTVLACNLLGDGVRVALDPRLRQRMG
jgi:peptide/nickel transport system permease protein